MFGTQASPPMVVNIKLLTYPRNVVTGPLTANQTIFMPPDISKIGNLVDTATLPNSCEREPCGRDRW